MDEKKKSPVIKLKGSIIGLCATGLLMFNPFLTYAQNESIRCIKIDQSRPLTLAENGKANFVIVVSPQASATTRFASKELKTFLDKALSADIPVTTQPKENIPSIIVGDCDMARKVGLDVKKLPRDGFYIKTAGNRIFILGVDDPTADPDKNMTSINWGNYYERATLFGVYDFLERFVGVRFYFPGDVGTVVPELKYLKVPAIDIVDSPDYTTRKFSWYSGKWFDHSSEANVLRNKHLNNYRMRTETDYIPNCHGLSYMEYEKRFGKTHPEYFALLASGKRNNEYDSSVYHQGQLCYTSALKEEIYKDAEAYLTGKPASSRDMKYWNANTTRGNRYFNVMPQDGFFRCLCPECSKYKGANSDSDIIWDMTGEVAEKLEKNKIPGYITQMAYGTSVYVPKRKLPDNILVMVATMGPWGDGKDVTRKIDDKTIIDWTKKLGHKVWLWNYAINESTMTEWLYGLPGTVQMSPVAIGKYYLRQAPYITGAFLESETNFFIMNYLNWYVFGKVCWDNKADLNAILDEHYKLMFGAASVPMKKFYEGLERIWTSEIKGRAIDTPLGPVSISPSNFDLWEKFYSPEKLVAFNQLLDEAEKLAQNNADSLKRVKFMREQLLDPLLDSSKKYFAEVNTLKTWIFPVKTITAEEKISIDGKLDDPAWKQSAKSFLLPYKSDHCEVKTKVYVLKDSKNLYLGFDCEEPDTARMKCPERKANDDNIWLDSCVEIHLNPSGDCKNVFQMIVNAAGSNYQIAAVKVGASVSSSKKWDSNTMTKTALEKNRWTAEIAIPLKNLGEIRPDGFPINFIRTRGLNGKEPKVLHYSWSPFIKSGFNEVENFGSMDFNPKEVVPVIKNGDFSEPQKDNKFGEWIFPLNNEYNKPAAGYSVSTDETTFIKGGQSLKMLSTGGLFAIEQAPIELKPDTKYHLSFYLKMEDIKPLAATGGGVQVQVYYGKQSCWFPKNPYAGTIPWTKQGFNFTTDAETKYGGIKLWIISAQGTVWFDDVAIKEIK